MLSFRQEARGYDLDLAHRDAHVQEAARTLARLDNPNLLVEAVLELIKRPNARQPTVREWRGRVQKYARSPEEEEAAYAALSLCFTLATKPDPPSPGHRRGALTERLVAELLRLRPMDPVREEVKFVLPDYVSARQDVVGVAPPPIEVHECKSDTYDLVQGVFDGMAEVRDKSEWHGIDVMLVISTLQSTQVLNDNLEDLEQETGLNVPAGFLQSTQENILALKTGPPRTRLEATVPAGPDA